jgi:hypothetical protein
MPPTLEKMTAPELKNLLKLEGLPVSGKKDELIARLREYSGKLTFVFRRLKDLKRQKET